MIENDISREIIGSALEVQRELGVGLLEGPYVAALALELGARGILYCQEVPVSGQYKGRPLGVAYRADLIVDGGVIVEVKAIAAVHDVHRAQLLSYLRLSRLKLGLLINFHVAPITRGVYRVVNKL